MQNVRKIQKLLFHVLAHIYHAHFNVIHELNLARELNIILSHLVHFGLTFELLEPVDGSFRSDEGLKSALVGARGAGNE